MFEGRHRKFDTKVDAFLPRNRMPRRVYRQHGTDQIVTFDRVTSPSASLQNYGDLANKQTVNDESSALQYTTGVLLPMNFKDQIWVTFYPNLLPFIMCAGSILIKHNI